MGDGPIPWQNVVIRYCPKCKLNHKAGTVRCRRCNGVLVDKVKRERLVEK